MRAALDSISAPYLHSPDHSIHFLLDLSALPGQNHQPDPTLAYGGDDEAAVPQAPAQVNETRLWMWQSSPALQTAHTHCHRARHVPLNH